MEHNMDDKLKLKTQEMGKDFDIFMEKVGKVEEVLRGMNSKDETKQKIAIQKADYLLGDRNFDKEVDEDCIYEKTNKTVINKAAFLKEDNPATMSQEAFMRSVEEDANRRANERREMKEISERHKKEGVKAFREQNYYKALKCFNEAINCIRDSALLYNNRCLTYLKLGLPKDALIDAEHALRLNEDSLKAHIYKAECLYLLGKTKESDQITEDACLKFPHQIQFLKETQNKWKK